MVLIGQCIEEGIAGHGINRSVHRGGYCRSWY